MKFWLTKAALKSNSSDPQNVLFPEMILNCLIISVLVFFLGKLLNPILFPVAGEEPKNTTLKETMETMGMNKKKVDSIDSIGNYL